MSASEQEYVQALIRCHKKIRECPNCLGGVTTQGIECVCKKKFDHLNSIYQAGIPYKMKNASLSQFFVKSDDKNIESLEAYLHFIDKMYQERTNLWIAGGTGSGKSLLICATLLKAIKSGYSSYYMDISEFYRLQEIRFSKISEEKYRYQNKLDFFGSVDFLAIDGIGLGSPRSREFGREALIELIKERLDANRIMVLGTISSEDKELATIYRELPNILKANFLSITLTGTDEYIQKKQDDIANAMKQLVSELKRNS